MPVTILELDLFDMLVFWIYLIYELILRRVGSLIMIYFLLSYKKNLKLTITYFIILDFSIKTLKAS